MLQSSTAHLSPDNPTLRKYRMARPKSRWNTPKGAQGTWIPPSPDRPKAHNKRRYKRNIERECITCCDELGTIDFPLADLPGKILTHLMLLGLAMYLREADNQPRTTWFALKRGLIHGDRRMLKKIPPLKPERALSPARRAIVETMLAYDGCRLDREQAQSIVRAMTPGEVALWNKEPDVIRARRAITGAKNMRLSDLIDRLQPVDPPQADHGSGLAKRKTTTIK